MGEQYACETGGTIAAGFSRYSPNTALIGDSLTDDSYGLTTFYGINALCGGKLALLSNAGVSANTVEDMLNRVDNSYLNASPGLSGLGLLGRVFIRAGTNNARGNIAIASLSTAFTNLLNKVAGYAQQVVILAVPPLSNAGNNATATSYNSWLENFAANNPSKFVFVDDCIGLRNPDGSQDTSCFNVDGVHFVGVGIARASVVAGSFLAPKMRPIASPISKDPLDIYPAQPQWFPNPTIAGTGGTKDGGFSGTVANGIWVGGNGAGMAGVCSVEQADPSDENQTPWQRIALSSGQVGSRLDVASTLVGRTITGSDPARLDAIAEIRVTSLDRSKLDSLTMIGQGGTGEYLIPQTSLFFDNIGLESRIYTIRARRPRSGATIFSSIGWHLYAGVRNSFSSSNVGTIDIRNITVRG